MTKKSILIIVPRLSSGGAERQAVTIAGLLKTAGYDISFLTYFKGSFFKDKLEQFGIIVHTKESNGFKRIFRVTRFITRGRYDVVLSFMQTPNFLNNFSKFFGNKRKIITSLRATPRKDEINSVQGKIYGMLYHNSDVIVSNSIHTIGVFSDFYPQYKNKLTTIYNAVQLGKVTKKYQIKKNNIVNFVIAATVSNIKNPQGLLKALILMQEEERKLLHIDWYGKKESVIGNHAEYDKVVEIIKQNHLQKLITLHDETKDITTIMNCADCVALFSKMEGLPNAICEGMMLGKPIVLTRVSDYAILVEEGVNGFLCDWDNPLSIKDALLKMSKLTAEELLKYGENSKEKAFRFFSSDAILKKWIDVIENN